MSNSPGFWQSLLNLIVGDTVNTGNKVIVLLFKFGNHGKRWLFRRALESLELFQESFGLPGGFGP